MSRLPAALVFAPVLCAVAAARQQSLVGEWKTQQGPVTILLSLKADGAGTFDDEKITYAARGDKLLVQQGADRNTYTFRLEGDTHVLSGGDIEGEMTFTRQGAGRGIGARARQRAAEAEGSASQESDSGTWEATAATTITRHSRTLGTQTHTLERRNHPKIGDPMLVIDGDAYVTYYQRPPWR